MSNPVFPIMSSRDKMAQNGDNLEVRAILNDNHEVRSGKLDALLTVA